MDTKKQRQCRHDDVRLTESGDTRSEQLNTRGAYRVANQQSLACLSGWLVFRYEISDLFKGGNKDSKGDEGSSPFK